ncbi:hypothetical protein [Herbaspirillum seropedicae]|uniref:hypothetical protein n=1 Tax=Herbaspirillum seropedicae TaxID=964 RepID=UPI0031E027A9
MFDFLYQCINAQMAVPLMRASRRMPAGLGVSLRGLILLSSRAHGKARKYSLFKDLASKGFAGFVAGTVRLGRLLRAFRFLLDNFNPRKPKNGQKKPGHCGSGFNPHH